MTHLPPVLRQLLNNMINGDQYSEHNMIADRDLPDYINFEFNVGDYVDPKCAISRFCQGPRKVEIKCNVRHSDPINGRTTFKSYTIDEQGNWKLKQYH